MATKKTTELLGDYGKSERPTGNHGSSANSLENGYLRDLRVDFVPVSALKPDARNPRTHSTKQIRQIANSIRSFGFTNPILIDAEGGVIAGHGRIEGAKLLGIEQLPTIRLADMSEAQKHAYLLADNKLAENAGWDKKLLALELQYIGELDLDFDLTVTGFETAEIDVLLQAAEESDNDAVGATLGDATAAASRAGDLWLLGEHRLLCADATKPDSFAALLDGAQAQMVFTDPPYNVPINGHVGGLGEVKHREFAMASGEMSEAQFTAFLRTICGHLAGHSVDGAIHFICMDWRHCFELLCAARTVYTEVKNLCVWNKDNGGMGSLYRSKHELVFVFKHGTRPHINNIELGRHGRNRCNVWDYPGVNSLGQDRREALVMHPTVKPVAMVADTMLDCSTRGGAVLDCFGGSGTTLIAAAKTGRRGYLIELDAAYVDVTIRRFQKFTGIAARHAATHRTFAEVEHERLSTSAPNQADQEEPANGK
jgi:DNA modification methylase